MVIAAGEASGGGEGLAKAGGEAAHVVVDVVDECAAEEQQEEPGCRICHLGDGDGDGEVPERLSGRLVRLGCGCRGELAAAHQRCAEAWFSIRGSRSCEICGETAANISGSCGVGKEFIRQWHETAGAEGGGSPKACGFCRSQAFCNLLIACLIIVFISPWFLHNHMV
ncbi:uncharacterized protein LOC133884322 isoform X1 [Phragmites australis]|uniref:uncharacterized protein LOC133884322 isoform X1 n=1 Tax=Phragmites australis TaxID=29695 RepID=UPI002D76D112|nr:uncharacterized protein LOC133884322 isoform X1 [Phragmites australis]